MKRTLLFALLLLGPWLSALSQDLTVATFNAEFLNRTKVHLKFGLPFDIAQATEEEQAYWNDDANLDAKLQEASANVAGMIKDMEADVVTLTEVGDAEDLKVLLGELTKIGVTYDYWKVCDCTDTFTGQHVAVISKYPLKEAWPQLPGRALYLEETDGDSERETGISKGLKVTVTVNEQDIDVFVMHLKSERGGYTSDAQRLAQANIARRAIIKQLNLGRKVIVTGDLNSQKGTESIYRIRGFDDVYEELIQTGHTQYFESTEVRWTYNYRGEPEQIDHILVSPGLTEREGIKTQILVSDETVSDHNPVIVQLTLK